MNFEFLETASSININFEYKIYNKSQDKNIILFIANVR